MDAPISFLDWSKLHCPNIQYLCKTVIKFYLAVQCAQPLRRNGGKKTKMAIDAISDANGGCTTLAKEPTAI